MSKTAAASYGDKLTLAGDPDAPLFRQAVKEINQMSEPELGALERFAQSVMAAREAKDEARSGITPQRSPRMGVGTHRALRRANRARMRLRCAAHELEALATGSGPIGDALDHCRAPERHPIKEAQSADRLVKSTPRDTPGDKVHLVGAHLRQAQPVR
jgi:hypothetical protein